MSKPTAKTTRPRQPQAAAQPEMGNVIPLEQVDPDVLRNAFVKGQRELIAAMQELNLRTDQLIAARGLITGLQEELQAAREEIEALKGTPAEATS